MIRLDIEALLQALPHRPPLDPPAIRDIAFVTWSGKPSPRYNGFTSDERLHTWQLVRWLEAQGVLAPLERCDICGSSDRLQRHSENYYNPMQAAIVCGSCHRLIHLRFWRWHEWRDLCWKHDALGSKWFSVLEIKQPDVAGYLREKHGPDTRNLKLSPLFTLPAHVREALSTMEFQQTT